MPKTTDISKRLREFGEKNFGSMAAFAKALAVTPQALNVYLSSGQKPGNIIQQKLRNLGCDVEWLMTGKTRDEPVLSDRERQLLVAMTELGIRSPEEIKRLVDENDKLRRALGPEVIAALSEAAIVMEKQAKNKIRKRKR